MLRKNCSKVIWVILSVITILGIVYCHNSVCNNLFFLVVLVVGVFIFYYILVNFIINQFKYYSAKSIILISVVSLIITIIIPLIIPMIPPNYIEENVSIIATGERGAKSQGSEVWIREINVDGVPLSSNSINVSKQWCPKDNFLLVSYQEQPATIDLKLKFREKVNITFLRHEWSGIVKIKYKNNEQIVDLSLKGRDVKTVTIKPIREGIINHIQLKNYIISCIILYIMILSIILLVINQFNVERKNRKVIGFLIIFMCISSYNLYNYSKGIVFLGDTVGYWLNGDSFIKNGKFSFRNLSDYTFRGYIIPLINLFIRKLASNIRLDSLLVFELINSLFFSFLIGVIIPNIYETIFKEKIKVKYILINFLIITYFFRGYYLYPLSDFVAFALFVISIKYFINIYFYNKESVMNFLLLGGFISAAVICRSNYKYSFYLMLLYIFANAIIKKYKLSTFSKNISMFLIGIFLVCLPQFIININKQKISIFPYNGTYAAGQSLNLLQLQSGIGVQKFLEAIYPDPHGISILYKEAGGVPGMYNYNDFLTIVKEHPINSYSEYLKLVVKHPVDFLCIYFRHFFNAMDIKVNSPYSNVVTQGTLFSTINYTLIFIFMILIYNNKEYLLKKSKVLFLIFIFILPSFSTIPGAIETRFFIPIYMVIYASFSYYIISRIKTYNMKEICKKYTFYYLMFILVCFTMSSANLTYLN